MIRFTFIVEKTNHKTLRTNQTEYHFKDMEPNTMYQISVSAQYASLTVLKSEEINVTTHPTMNHTDSNTGKSMGILTKFNLKLGSRIMTVNAWFGFLVVRMKLHDTSV